MTYYELPFTIPSGATLTNQNYWKIYKGLEVTARKRYSDRWMLNGSLAYGTTPACYGEGGYLDPTSIEFVNGAEENTRNAKWVFKQPVDPDSPSGAAGCLQPVSNMG